MFPSSKACFKDDEHNANQSWLRNASFTPQVTTSSSKQEDAPATSKPQAPVCVKRSPPLLTTLPVLHCRTGKIDDGGYCYELDRKGDPANLGADRTYFKQLPKYTLRKCSSKRKEKPAKRYFRAPGLDNALRPVEFLRRPVAEWLSVYVDEQEVARNLKHGNQRLQQFLDHIRSALQVDHPNDGRLRCIEFRLRRQLGESSIELVDEWRRSLRSAIYDFDDWGRYLSFLKSSSAHRMSDIRREYLEYMNIQLADIEDSGGTYERYERLIDTLLSYALSLSDAGYNENAVALFQALIDYNMVQLATTREASIGQYRQFWLSGLPRLGEQGYKCWWLCDVGQESASSPHEDPTEPFGLDTDLPQPLQWLQNEVQRERAHWLPFRRLNFTDLEDPLRYVKFTDLFIFRIPPAALNKLAAQLILSLGILLGPGILPPLPSPAMVALIERLPSLYHILSTGQQISGRIVGNPSTLLVKDYFRRIMEQLSRFESQRFADLFHALSLIELSLSDADAKKVLAKHRQNVALFAAYFAMYPNQRIVAESTSLSLLLSQADHVDIATLQTLRLPQVDEAASDMEQFNANLLMAAIGKRGDVFKDKSWLQEQDDLHVRRRRFLHYCRLALHLGTLTTEEFASIVVSVIEMSIGKEDALLYDCSLAQFLIDMLSRRPRTINLVKRWSRCDWVVCVMRLYNENERLRQFLSSRGECSALPPVNRMRNLTNEAVDCYPESVLFHRLRSGFSSQFLSSVETELAFTSSRLQVPFDKSVYMDHIRWVATHCLNRPDFEWRTLVQSMEQDRGIRIKLPLPEFDELRNIYKQVEA